MRHRISWWWSLALVVGAIALVPRGARALDNSFWFGDQMQYPVGLGIHGFMLTPNPQLSPDPTHPVAPLNLLIGAAMGFNNWKGEQPGLKIYDPRETWGGYTLLSSLGGHKGADGRTSYAILIDMNGNIVKEWPAAFERVNGQVVESPVFAFPTKMLPGGSIIAHVGDTPQHQEYQRLVQLDWCGNLTWSWDGFRDGQTDLAARAHHDFQREGSPVGYFSPLMQPRVHNGNTLVLSHYNPDPSLTQHITDYVDADGYRWGLEDDALYEVDWKGNVVWRWVAWEHFDQMGFDPVAKQAIRITPCVQTGCQPIGAPANIGGGFKAHDWQHLNSASYLGPNKWYEKGDERFHPDNIIIDGRSSNMIAIIARHDARDGKWKAGDIVWRTGPHYYYGLEDHKLDQIIGQHHVHMIPPGLPGAGNILAFDNGGLAGYGNLAPGGPAFWPSTHRNYSRVVEYNPVTKEIVWEYTNLVQKPGERKFFSWFISSAQRLMNGNTLIDEGSTGRIFEVTREGKVVWEFISPFADRGGTGFSNAVYRAYRIPYWWVPANRNCPERPPVETRQ